MKDTIVEEIPGKPVDAERVDSCATALPAGGSRPPVFDTPAGIYDFLLIAAIKDPVFAQKTAFEWVKQVSFLCIISGICRLEPSKVSWFD
jgi:hypothetical protein